MMAPLEDEPTTVAEMDDLLLPSLEKAAWTNQVEDSFTGISGFIQEPQCGELSQPVHSHTLQHSNPNTKFTDNATNGPYTKILRLITRLNLKTPKQLLRDGYNCKPIECAGLVLLENADRRLSSEQLDWLLTICRIQIQIVGTISWAARAFGKYPRCIDILHCMGANGLLKQLRRPQAHRILKQLSPKHYDGRMRADIYACDEMCKQDGWPKIGTSLPDDQYERVPVGFSREDLCILGTFGIKNIPLFTPNSERSEAEKKARALLKANGHMRLKMIDLKRVLYLCGLEKGRINRTVDAIELLLPNGKGTSLFARSEAVEEPPGEEGALLSAIYTGFDELFAE